MDLKELIDQERQRALEVYARILADSFASDPPVKTFHGDIELARRLNKCETDGRRAANKAMRLMTFVRELAAVDHHGAKQMLARENEIENQETI